MEYKEILYDVKDKILTITMNRPDRLNAFTPKMMEEMIDAFSRADADDDIRAVIVTGAGRGFCAGADLGSGGSTFDYKEHVGERSISMMRDGGGLLTLRIYDCIKPVIAAVNGPAVGVGATMTLAMDIRIASEKARFGFVFARRGIVPEACSSWFLPRAVGISKALEWAFSGRVFPAEEALSSGLVRSVHPPEELLEAANGLAREIADNTSAVSVALIRQMMWRMLGADHPMEAHKIDTRGVLWTGKSDDAREGVMAFLEKRPAKYTNKPSKDMPDFYPWWKDRPFE
ncbi:MAG: crotonase/enoyl-CoA hydratase family protein [Deltaproteobacteria bacterium]|nr:crotonase/enoyl-CoA hydratase family protein [Deltaproteobacteria bacterium]